MIRTNPQFDQALIPTVRKDQVKQILTLSKLENLCTKPLKKMFESTYIANIESKGVYGYGIVAENFFVLVVQK